MHKTSDLDMIFQLFFKDGSCVLELELQKFPASVQTKEALKDICTDWQGW